MLQQYSPEKRYFHIFWRWLWLLVLVPIIASITAFIAFNNQPQTYEAEAQLLIGPSTNNPSPDLNALRASEHLMQTYRKMAMTDTFLQSIIDDLKLNDVTPADLRSQIELLPDTTSLVISITAMSTSPDQAIAVANAVANGVVRISPNNPENPAASLRQQNQAQAVKLQASMDQSESRLAALEASITKLDTETSHENAAFMESLAADQSRVNSLENNLITAKDLSLAARMSLEILNEMTENTLARIQRLEQEFSQTDANLQPIITAQISAERDHLTGLQQAVAQVQRPVEGQTLAEYIQARKTNIERLQAQPQRSFDVSYNRLVFDQITQERTRLSEAEKIAAGRQQLVLGELGEERTRLSAMQALPVENRRYLNEQIASERVRLDNMQSSYSALNDAIYQAWTNQAQVTQLAVQALPVADNFKLILIMSALAGLTLAIAIVLAIGFFDRSIQTSQELETLLGVPVSGMVWQTLSLGNGRQNSLASRLVVRNQPGSQLAEAYRQIIAGLSARLNGNSPAALSGERTGSPAPLRTLLIGSINENEASGEVAANLALTLAETGQKVLLVDANLHQPRIADLFQVRSTSNFSTYLSASERPVELSRISDHLAILPGAAANEQAFGLAASEALPRLIEALKGHARYVVMAGAPLLAYADSVMVARQADGILLVVREGNVHRDQIERFVKAMQAYHWQVLGLIVMRKQVAWSLPDLLGGRKQKSGAKKQVNRGLQSGPVLVEIPETAGRDTAGRPAKNETVGRPVLSSRQEGQSGDW